ncbi:MAG: D-alanyl-D-alanine carboxypeptidase [Lachnospiraceae bacterium]|nr:D-alanyl-D-alanine carboxypeptidase [Lachnospiraceae bacterium]
MERNRNMQGSRYSDGGSSRYAKRSGSRYADKNGSRGISGKRRRRSPGNQRLLYICVIIFLVLLIICGVGTLLLYRSSHGERPQITVDLETLDSPYAVLMDAESGEVLASKKGEEIIFPASMVKIMTVLTAVENIKKLDTTITMSYDYYETLYEQDASRAGFEPGEEAVIRDLLYGALLPSGAECCMELAVQAAGSETAFVELMNQKAGKLGLTQTHFTNCTGLHNDDQYSTAEEIGKILQAALKNKTFYKVFTTQSYTVQATQVHPEGFTFQSSMFKNMESPTVIGGEIKGGKTGYTDEAGHCLASMAEIGGREYILVTAGWAADPRTEQYHINDAFLAYNQIGRSLAL